MNTDNEQADELDWILEAFWVDAQQIDTGSGMWKPDRMRKAKAALQDYIAQHTKEAVEAARIYELERLYRVARRGNYYEAEIRDRLAELAAPQQSKERSK